MEERVEINIIKIYKRGVNMKTILITGGSRGIGKCIAENLAKDGFNVVLNYNKSEKQAKQIKKEL